MVNHATMWKKVPLDHLVNVWVDPPHLYLVLGPAALQVWPHGSAGSRTFWPPLSNGSLSANVCWVASFFTSTGQLGQLCSRTRYPPLVNWVTCVHVLFTLHWLTGSPVFSYSLPSTCQLGRIVFVLQLWGQILFDLHWVSWILYSLTSTGSAESCTLWPPLGLLFDVHWVSWASYSSLVQRGYLQNTYESIYFKFWQYVNAVRLPLACIENQCTPLPVTSGKDG